MVSTATRCKVTLQELTLRARDGTLSDEEVVYINLRPKVFASDWNTDEIHPNRNGAVKIAAAFNAKDPMA